MLIFTTVREIRHWLDRHADQRTIGFVPTMGALHEGHISLIEKSKLECSLTVCSIFVNPAQFNDARDLALYPRTYEADVTLLAESGTDLLFFPSVEEIYPHDFVPVNVDLGGLDLVMEGLHRPGHFAGVVRVVHRLLDIIRPNKLYMGQKDLQQFTIIRRMIEQLAMPVQLIICPIAREPHGLAMSSRNRRLSAEGRAKAGLIYQALLFGKTKKPTFSPPETMAACLEKLRQPGFNPEYFEIVDPETLQPVNQWPEAGRSCVACTAVWLEGVRLIDNEFY